MTFQKGNKFGKGKPRGYQNFIDRAVYLLEHNTAERIVEIVSDKKHWKTVSGRDLIIFMTIAESFKIDGGARFEKLLDRILGKPTQQINVDQNVSAKGTIEHWSVSEIERWITEVTGDEAKDSAAPPVLN